jgi:serine/threonine protein kinase/tetratricopeptide (TPR) repeat protein
MTDDFDRLSAVLKGRYTIERELGAGGMATVYLAMDLKHERKVAVKVLRPELAAVLGAERFLTEIRVTANLQHPHILPLHDSGEADSFLYYVMPYVEGESLRDRLNREKQLPIDDALAIAAEVADALGSAHRQGVVHRDIKPENILLREDHALVADYGIALAVKSAGGDRLTETGMSLGTPAYMSPEQVAGDRDIDGRSDIYSLACVLYEMLAGDPPFVASNPQAVLARHVTDPAPPITTVRSSVSQPVATTIEKALGKARADRFDSAKAFADALFAEPTDAEPEVKSIVVLPFENLSPDPEQEYFSDGLTEDTITALSRIEALRVTSRNSAMQLKGTDKDTRSIGRELNVQYVLEGSVRKAGERLRITAQLIDAEADVQIWAEKYDGVIEDVFDMQDKVSSSIVSALELKLSPGEERTLGKRPIDNVQAYECYLLARKAVFQWTPEALALSMRHLQNAQEIIGENALLLSAMAYVCWQYVNMGLEHDEYMNRAEDYANKALELDSECAEAHLVLGVLWQAFRGDQARSFMHLKKALSIKPNESHALTWLVAGHALVGRIREALPLAERLSQIDPLSALSRWDPFLRVFGGRLDWSLEDLTYWIRMEPQNLAALNSAAWLFTLCGYREEVPRLVEQHSDATMSDIYTALSLSFKHAIEGNVTELRHRVTEDVKRTARRDAMWSYMLADIYAIAGMADDALDWLDKALNRGWVNYPFTAQHDPSLVPLHDEPRFQQITERMKKDWQEFEV